MTDLLTLTLNPALDLSSAGDAIVPGPKLRLDPPLAEPGGGGLNVARAAKALGGQVRALAVLGGATGAQVAALMAAAGVPVVAFPARGETRQSLAVTDRATGGMYRMQFPGPAWDAAQTGPLLDAVVAEAAALAPGGLVVLSGSQPPGLEAAFPQTLSARLGPARRLLIDTSGAPLEHLLRAPATPPDILRMDQAESEALSGRPLPGLSDSLALAGDWVAAGVARMVVLARGAEGSVLAGPGGLRLHCRPPLVPVVSKVGAGDSFVGAFALAQARGASPGEALVQGTAAAAAAVMTPGSALCRPGDVRRLAADCVLTAA